jgi:hypothetical protein
VGKKPVRRLRPRRRSPEFSSRAAVRYYSGTFGGDLALLLALYPLERPMPCTRAMHNMLLARVEKSLFLFSPALMTDLDFSSMPASFKPKNGRKKICKKLLRRKVDLLYFALRFIQIGDVTDSITCGADN